MYYTDIMIDLEFLSLKAHPVIISIGAVAFEVDTQITAIDGIKQCPVFYHECELQRQIEHGRTIDEGTLRWWMDQSHKAREILKPTLPDANKYFLRDALIGLSTWIARMGGAKKGDNQFVERLWSHGAACDMALLGYAYDDCKLIVPWHYPKIRDTRTLYEQYDDTKITNLLDMKDSTKHNARDDAINQMLKVQAIWCRLQHDRKGR